MPLLELTRFSRGIIKYKDFFKCQTDLSLCLKRMIKFKKYENLALWFILFEHISLIRIIEDWICKFTLLLFLFLDHTRWHSRPIPSYTLIYHSWLGEPHRAMGDRTVVLPKEDTLLLCSTALATEFVSLINLCFSQNIWKHRNIRLIMENYKIIYV